MSRVGIGVTIRALTYLLLFALVQVASLADYAFEIANNSPPPASQLGPGLYRRWSWGYDVYCGFVGDITDDTSVLRISRESAWRCSSTAGTRVGSRCVVGEVLVGFPIRIVMTNVEIDDTCWISDAGPELNEPRMMLNSVTDVLRCGGGGAPSCAIVCHGTIQTIHGKSILLPCHVSILRLAVAVVMYTLTGLAVELLYRTVVVHVRRRLHRCPRCGYSLKGLVSPRCPECGNVTGVLAR